MTGVLRGASALGEGNGGSVDDERGRDGRSFVILSEAKNLHGMGWILRLRADALAQDDRGSAGRGALKVGIEGSVMKGSMIGIEKTMSPANGSRGTR